MVSPWEEFQEDIKNLKAEYPDFPLELEEIEKIQNKRYQESVEQLLKEQAEKRAEREQRRSI